MGRGWTQDNHFNSTHRAQWGAYACIAGTDLTKPQLWSEEPHSLSPEMAPAHLAQDLGKGRVSKTGVPSIPHS